MCAQESIIELKHFNVEVFQRIFTLQIILVMAVTKLRGNSYYKKKLYYTVPVNYVKTFQIFSRTDEQIQGLFQEVVTRAGQVRKLVRKSANPQLRTNEKSC